MSAWVMLRRPSPKPWIDLRPKRRYSRTAPHIRGRVYRMGYKTTLGDWMWGMEVINTSTGQVIASDNCAVYSKILDACEEATAAARAAWFWSYSPKKVKA